MAFECAAASTLSLHSRDSRTVVGVPGSAQEGGRRRLLLAKAQVPCNSRKRSRIPCSHVAHIGRYAERESLTVLLSAVATAIAPIVQELFRSAETRDRWACSLEPRTVGETVIYHVVPLRPTGWTVLREGRAVGWWFVPFA
jgi:hypothetical protein